MELLQATLFTTRYILENGNYDLYYVFFTIVFVFFITKKSNCIIKIFRFYLPFLFVGMIMLVAYPHLHIVKFFVYEAKILLCITCMVYIQVNYCIINWRKFIKLVCIILGLETIIAIVWSTNKLWRLNDLINRYTTKRLELFYLEPSGLGIHCGLILLILLWIWWNNKERKYFYIEACVLLCDMLLCASLSGILGIVIAGLVMVLYASFQYFYKRKKIRVKQLNFFLISLFLLVLLAAKKGAILQRVQAVISGSDSSFLSRFVYPLRTLTAVMVKTNGKGVGFGNLNTEYGLGVLDGVYKYSCSFPYFIAEAGGFAIVIIILFVAWLIKLCAKSRDSLCWGLLVYVLVMQIAGGYFTDPLIYAIYGLIIGRAKYIAKEVKYYE